MTRFSRPATPSERNSAAVTALYRAWNWGQLGALLDLLHSEVEWSDGHDPEQPLRSGIDTVERDTRSLMAVLDVSYHLQSLTDLDGRLLAEGLLTHGGGFPSRFFHLFDLRDGLIARRRVFATRDAALAAAAYTQLEI